ncbi:MAG: hypothetical protein HQM16_08375 [Deltaproteobacteria bacterium]|nr:hypothetical protein [Deltaproteobacteria bacterium]
MTLTGKTTSNTTPNESVIKEDMTSDHGVASANTSTAGEAVATTEQGDLFANANDPLGAMAAGFEDFKVPARFGTAPSFTAPAPESDQHEPDYNSYSATEIKLLLQDQII